MVGSAALLRIREARHALRLAQLEGEGIRTVTQDTGDRSCRVLLFGSLTRSDWDGLSERDLLALDPTGLERCCAGSPYRQAIAREACPLLGARP